MGMKLRERKFGLSVVVQVTGKIESSDAIKISKHLESLGKKKIARAVLDMSKVNFLDSHWLGVLVYCWKVFREQNKELVFVVPPGYVRNLFVDICLDRTFRIFDTVEEAVQ